MRVIAISFHIFRYEFIFKSFFKAYSGIDLKPLDKLPDDMKDVLKEEIKTENERISNSMVVDETDGSSTSTKDLGKSEDEQTMEELERLKIIVGNSIQLIQMIKKSPTNTNVYMSPLLSDTEVLKKMPKTYLIVSTIILLI